MSIKSKTKRFVSALAAFVLLLFCAVPSVGANVEALTFSVSIPSEVETDNEFYIKISLDNIPSPLLALELRVDFDNNYVNPVITENQNNEMDAFLAVNTRGWLQFCRLDTQNSCYYLRFCAPSDEMPEEYLISDASSLVIEIPFKAVRTGKAEFNIPSDGIMAFDGTLLPIAADRAEVSVNIVNMLSRFDAVLSAPESSPRGSVCGIGITVTNTRESGLIAAYEMDLFFDASSAVPIITSNKNSEMDSFIVSLPNGWQQFCSFLPAESCYRLRLVAPNGGINPDDCLNIGESISLCIPFALLGDEGSALRFRVGSEHCFATACDLRTIVGNGGECLVTVSAAEGFEPLDPGVYVNEGLMFGLPAGVDAETIAAYLAGDVRISANGEAVSGLLGSGMTITLFEDGAPIASAKAVIRGDADGNGKITAADCLITKRIILGTYQADRISKLACSVSGGVSPTAYDYYLIKRHFLGLYDLYSK